jgi:hypothetical protein
VEPRSKTSPVSRILVGGGLILGLSMAVAAAPAADSEAGGPRARALDASKASSSSSSLVETLSARFPALRARLSGSGTFERIASRSGSHRIRGRRPRRGGPADTIPGMDAPVDVVFPTDASGPVVAEGEGVGVVLQPRGTKPVSAEIVDGKLVYRGLYPETDSVHVVADEWTEEYLLLQGKGAPNRFEYELVRTRGVTTVRVDHGQVQFLDANGKGLVILEPVVVDAAGRRSATAARWELDEAPHEGARRLTLHLDPAGLEYPLVIDPSWITTGSMNTARLDGIGILLHSGKVLVMAGAPNTQVTSELYDPATGVWSAGPPVGLVGRAFFAAVLLRDGRVLVTGGRGPSGQLSSCYLYDPDGGTWSPAASLAVGRDSHTATLLPDGRVLVAGGQNPLNNPINSAEIYDPVNNTWAPTGSLNVAHRAHSATQLDDGRVLVAGGVTIPPLSATAVSETYDPGSGAWTRVGDLTRTRYLHSATLLPDGRVLALGSFIGDNTAELFDPGTDTWSATDSLAATRYEHSATLLPNGRVLVAGGGAGAGAGTESYDPGTELWSPGPNMASGRFRHSATMLPDGRVLVAGGFSGAVLAAAELYDNDVPAWTAVPDMNADRNEATATLLKNGRVLVAGGAGESTAEVFDPGDLGPPIIPPTWTPTGNTMSVQRWRHSATLLLDGRVLVAGSRANTAASRTADVFDPGGNTWSATGDLVGGRSTHTATLLPDGEVLIAGGQTNTAVILGTAERFDPGTDTWRSTTSMGTVRWRQAATLLRDGRVLVTGGFEAAALDTAEIYDPTNESWTPVVAAMTVPRYFHTSTLLPSGKVLLVGGETSAGSAELFDPATGTFATTGSPNLAHDTNFTATLLRNGRVLVVGGVVNPQAAEVYDPVTGTWTVVPNTIGERAAHAAALLPDGRVLVAGSLPIGPTAEVYDVGRGEDPLWRPVLATVTDPLEDGAPLVATGSQFQGLSEASTGLGYMHSATNYPLIQLRRLDNEDVRWLFVDPVTGWSDTDFTSLPLGGLAPGPALVTVFTNGIPSDSRLVTVGCSAPVITAQPTGLNLCLGSPAVFSVGTSASFPSYEWRKNGTPLVDGGPISGASSSTLVINPTALTDAGTYDVVISTCSTTTALSAPAILTVSNAPNLTNVAVTLISPPATVCTTCVGGTISESHTNGGVVTHEWGYRTVPTTGPITWAPGRTGPTYDINGVDFPGPGTYYVVARTTPACGLPLVSSNEVTVTVTLSPPGDEVEFFTVTSRNAENVLEWVNSAIFGTVRILYNEGVTCTFPTNPLGPGTLLPVPPGAPGLRDGFVHNSPPLTNGRTYCYTIFTDQGAGVYSVGRSNRGRPMNTAGPVKWAFSTGVFSLTAPTVSGAGVIATSNDNVVHAMERGLGGGVWPAPWLPVPVDGPIQSRSPVVPITVNGASPVVYLGTQAGSVYAIDGVNGGAAAPTPWFPSPSTSIATDVQAAPAGMFTAFGGTYDYLLVGTREADNEFVALNPMTGAEIDRFDNGGTPIGIISGMASVDYSTDRVYFTSFEHPSGSPMTLWALQLGSSPVFTPAWAMPRALGSIASSPVLLGGRVYVGSPLPSGTLYSIDAATGAGLDRTFPHNDGQVKGFAFPDRSPGDLDLYFATDNFVWAVTDTGAPVMTNKFPPTGITLDVGVVPTSAVLFIPGSHYVYVGGSDGKLYEIDVLGPVPVIKSVQLGDGLATVGAPSLDWTNNLIHVGTEAGVFYAVDIPFP